MVSQKMQQNTFLLLLIVVSLAFGWILWPFYGAVFWATVLAIIFMPFHRRVLRGLAYRRNTAAIVTLLACLVSVILPLSAITSSLIQDGVVVYERMRSGEIDFGSYFQQAMESLPAWLSGVLRRLGLSDLSGLQEKLTAGAAQVGQVVAKQAVSIGQNTLDFVVSFGIMLYLLFFFLRDGTTLAARIKQAIPLTAEHKQKLFSKFTTVIRATVKGNIVVAATQGALGGGMFWFLGIQGALLWGVIMAFLSLLPAVGAGLIWLPVAIYFLLTGALWHGVALILFGVFVIGLVDNVLRPLLVGKDTKLPDYVVLISTLGGMGLFGLNGFVIGPVIAALFIAAWDLFSSPEMTKGDAP